MPRGRSADTPTDIPTEGWKDIALRVKDEVTEDRVGLIAAGIAFYGLLAVFPAVTAFMAIGGLFLEPDQIIGQLDSLSGILPQNVIEIIRGQATGVATASGGGLGLAAVFGILFAFYSASNGVASLMEGLNVAYDEKEKRGFVKLKLVTFALTLAMLIGLLVGLAATLALPAALALLNLGGMVETVLTVAVWGGVLALSMVGLAILYRYAPSRDAPQWQWASSGAILGCLVWVAASAGFAFYVSNFGSYNATFGAIAGVIVLLMWFWISAYVVLMGGELNAEMEAQTRRDSTVGPDAPMGQRGAQKADHLGAAAGE